MKRCILNLIQNSPKHPALSHLQACYRNAAAFFKQKKALALVLPAPNAIDLIVNCPGKARLRFMNPRAAAELSGVGFARFFSVFSKSAQSVRNPSFVSRALEFGQLLLDEKHHAIT